MAPGASLCVTKRPEISFSLLHFLLFVSSTLVVASWPSYGEAMVDGRSMMENSVGVTEMGMETIRRGLASAAPTPAVNSTQNLLEDSEALLAFKAALTSDPFNVTRYWKRQGKRQVLNACRWVGITCAQRRVTGVNLFNQSLEGTVSPALGRLSRLATLNLSNNLFSGVIPPELTAAILLETLDVGNNDLTGSLPSSLGDMKNLTSLVVADNRLAGSIPTSIGNLQSLKTLNISGNNLTGVIPVELGNALALEILDMSNNSLTGTIPIGIGSLKNLTVLKVAKNMLSGGLPTTLGQCQFLVSLDFSNNLLSGSIPPTLGDLKGLETLRLANSSLTGVIPQELRGCTKLTEIDLSNNRLHGAIPFDSLANLTVLHLQNNLLEGDFVTYIGMFPILEDLDLTNNRLNGSIPSTIGDLPLRYQLSLAHNVLTGSIPDGMGGLSLVERMDLSSNSLSGSIPDAIRNCISLEELDVSSNALSGILPMSLVSLTSLTGLNVSHNLLNGSLPVLNQLTNLKVFDASFNNFSGQVPPTFVNFSSLVFLNVSYNDLQGEVPAFAVHDNVTAQSFRNNALCGAVLNIGCGGSGKPSRKTIIYIVVGSAAALILALAVLFLCVACLKGRNGKGSKHSATVSAELQLKVTPEEVLIATKAFNEVNYIGVGSMSTVYRGRLPDDTIVAVKRLAIRKGEGKEDAEDILDEELEVLGHIRHRTLVKVLGYCSSPEVKALVLEYMPNGSLDSLLYPPQGAEVVREFDWTLRFNAAIGVAQGLKYLHHECRNPVVHGDIKPSNILFDANMEARIGDFGVARILAAQGYGPNAGPSSSGYTPPEIVASGRPSVKGDVYSYGIVLLEMISGRNPNTLEAGQTLPQWIRSTISNSKALQNVLDPILMGDVTLHQQKMAMVLGVALLCTRDNPHERPLMDGVLKMLLHIRTRSVEGSRRKGLATMSRRSASAVRRNTSVNERAPMQPLPPLPHTPSLSDWTPSAGDV